MSGHAAIRIRRRHQGSGGLSPAARVGVLILVGASLLAGVVAAGMARLYLEVTQQVPAVENIEAYFQEDGPAGLRPSRIVDSAGQQILSLENESASEREWVGLDAGAPVVAPEHLTMALLARQDSGFWDNKGYERAGVLSVLVQDLLGRSVRARSLTISEQLISSTLLPVEPYANNSIRKDFRLALLAERLNSAFDKRTILTWYLNSASFGHLIHGVDGAALAYFGKHADELTAGESAVLAAMPGHVDEVLANATAIRRAQRVTLTAMQEQGLISARDALDARAAPLHLNHPPELAISGGDSLERTLLAQAEVEVGPSLFERGGLTITSTVNRDLQRQTSCLLQAQIDRLNAGSSNGQALPAQTQVCPAVDLLPLMRPGDAGVDHGVTSGSVVVLDPNDGTLLAAADLGWQAAESGFEAKAASDRMVYPFVYLTAFSRGLSPGSMVLDLPVDTVEGSDSLASYRGPERMRTALANGDRAAAARTADVAGLANVGRTLRELALISTSRSVDVEGLVDGELPTSLLDLSYSYAVVANQGLMVTADPNEPVPILIQSVADPFGRTIHAVRPSTKVVLGEGLSYLLLDVLTDGSAASAPNPLVAASASGRPQGAVHAATDDGVNWSIFFTPSALVGVRIDSDRQAAEKAATPENSSDPLAMAVLRLVSAGQPTVDWKKPAHVEEVEVCDPSGLLPTLNCPKVVTEVFLQGTEPTAPDDLYQSFRVNKESGRLATLQTPLEMVEERVYMVPPPEAAVWARQAGIERPPTEYDPLVLDGAGDSDVSIDEPSAFDAAGGELVVSGRAHPPGLRYYRLQYGRGLNPARWTQIGEDHEARVWGGSLGGWDTTSLSGLYTLQLIAVLDQGQIITDSIPLTIDNQPPNVQIRQPEAGSQLASPITVEIDATDDAGIAWVDVYVDGRKRIRLEGAPFLWTARGLALGEHELVVRSQDEVGNETETAPLPFSQIH